MLLKEASSLTVFVQLRRKSGVLCFGSGKEHPGHSSARNSADWGQLLAASGFTSLVPQTDHCPEGQEESFRSSQPVISQQVTFPEEQQDCKWYVEKIPK